MPDQNIQWHPGFFAGIELEFKSYQVEIEKEYQLTRGPLQIDLLIIKKLTDERIDNDIGRIFRRHNIIEYKSPDDELSIDVYYKVQAYASLYKASGNSVNEIPADSITVTLFRDTYPRTLMELLKAAGSNIQEKYPGVYYVSGNTLFPTQIIVSSRFKKREHSGFQILSRNAPREEVIAFLQNAARATDQGDRARVDSILQVSVSANYELYQDIHKEDIMCEALKDLMKDDFDRTLFQGMQQGIQQGMQQGMNKANRDALLALMKNLNFSPLQAMDALNIPEADRSLYSDLLKQ